VYLWLRAMVRRRFDKKFSVLIVIIVCALVTGLTLTYISDTDGVRSGLRGITGHHDRFDSDIEPESRSRSEPEQIQPDPTDVSPVLEPILPINEIRNPETPNNESVGGGILIAYDLFERINASIIAPELNNATLVPSNESNSQPLLLSVDVIAENSTHSPLPLLLTMIPEAVETAVPTSQPSVLVEQLQSYFIPIKASSAQQILDEIFRTFWTQKTESLSDTNGDLRPSEPSANLITHLHSALKHGEVCSDLGTKNSKFKPNKKLEIASKGLFDPLGLSSIHQRILHELLSRDLSLFIEYSRLNLRYTIPLSFSISSHHPDCLNVLFDSSFGSLQSQKSRELSKSKRICGAMRYPTPLYPPSNIIIASPPTSDTLRKDRWRDRFDCFQLVNSFEDILPSSNSQILPFEFEDSLGELLCRCNVTVLPSQLPSSSFFTYWESVDLLLDESMRNIQDSCSIEVNRTGAKKYSRYESEYYWVSRNDVEAVASLSAEVLLSSPLIHPVSRHHLLTKLISSSQNHSLTRELRNHPDGALKAVANSLLASNFLIPHERSGARSLPKSSEGNTTSKVSSSPRTDSPSRKPTSSFHFSSFRATSSPSQNNESSSRRRLSDSQSSSKLSTKFGENELSKKRYQFISPARVTFWSALTHRGTSKDEFDEWIESEGSQQDHGPEAGDDEPE
jgi:hypothetical protein